MRAPDVQPGALANGPVRQSGRQSLSKFLRSQAVSSGTRSEGRTAAYPLQMVQKRRCVGEREGFEPLRRQTTPTVFRDASVRV